MASSSRHYPIRYADFGADLYGLALVTTKKYAEENPDVVRAMVKALNKGTIDTIKDPAAALQTMKARDPMMKDEIEKIRLDMAVGLTDTKWVRGNGLSVVQPERLKKTIDAVVGAFGLTVRRVRTRSIPRSFCRHSQIGKCNRARFKILTMQVGSRFGVMAWAC